MVGTKETEADEASRYGPDDDMANGRIVNCKIVHNPIIRDVMQTDTERLTFTWLITFADGFGRHLADAKVIRGLLYAARAPEEHPTWEEMEEYLERWNEAGIIGLYEADGQRYLHFPKWRQNQPGLRMKERPSIPPPPGVNDETFPTSWYDEEKATMPYDPNEPHMKIATAWYKRYAEVTARLVRPGPSDYLSAKGVFDRCEIDDVMKAVEFYFRTGLVNWWALDKKDRRQYNFQGFCKNIATIMAAMNEPEDQQLVARHCRYCGLRRMPTSTGPCPKCGTLDGSDRPPKKTVPSTEEDNIDTDQSATADSAEQF